MHTVKRLLLPALFTLATLASLMMAAGASWTGPE
jgi:hypothetical protein